MYIQTKAWVQICIIAVMFYFYLVHLASLVGSTTAVLLVVHGRLPLNRALPLQKFKNTCYVKLPF